MKIFDCNNHVKSTIEFFGPSCAVNSLLDKYNPMGNLNCFLLQITITIYIYIYTVLTGIY